MLPLVAAAGRAVLIAWFLLCPTRATTTVANAAGQDRSPQIAGIRVGIEGRYKAGLWTPVEVRLLGVEPSANATVTLTVPDGDGVPNLARHRLGDLDTKARQDGELSALLYTRIGRTRSQLTVELRLNDRIAATKTFKAGETEGFGPALSSDQKLIVVVGSDASAVEDAIKLERKQRGTGNAIVRLSSWHELPTRWYGYDGVDRVLLFTAEPGIYSDLKPDDPRMLALDQWIAMGGYLVLCVGAGAEELLGREPPSALAQLVPGNMTEIVGLRQLGGLETYAGGSTRIPGIGRGGRMNVPQLAQVHGRVDAREGNVPLVVRSARGLGQVVFVATDLDRGPIAEWPDRPVFVCKLLDIPDAPVEDFGEGTAVMHYGFTDMAGQLRSALDHFQGVSLVPFSLVVGLVVIYALLIGPGDYFFLRKIVGRMQVTWITYPLTVVVVAAGAYALAYGFKGTKVRMNQAAVLDFDAAGGQLRGAAWMNVFSPRMDRYDFSFEPSLPGGRQVTGGEVFVSWLGLTGNALGGMDPQAAEPTAWRGQYEISPAMDAMREVPIPIWSTKSLTARWTAPVDIGLKADLGIEDQLPVGTITNEYGFPLSGCVLLYDRWAYELGAIKPGETVRVGPLVRRRSLKSLLTGQKLIFEDKDKPRQQATPYDRASVDETYVLRTMMFFEKAGGRRYTGLDNDYQGRVDLSDLLKTGRAILVAYPPDDESYAGGRLLRGGKPLSAPDDRYTTVYRFVFPVNQDSHYSN
jgi:hypothetical protein